MKKTKGKRTKKDVIKEKDSTVADEGQVSSSTISNDHHNNKIQEIIQVEQRNVKPKLNELLTQASELIDSTPAHIYLRGIKQASSLREGLEKLFAYQGSIKTSIRNKLRKGRPRILRGQKLEAEQIWSLLQLWSEPLLTYLEGMVNAFENASFDIHLLGDLCGQCGGSPF